MLANTFKYASAQNQRMGSADVDDERLEDELAERVEEKLEQGLSDPKRVQSTSSARPASTGADNSPADTALNARATEQEVAIQQDAEDALQGERRIQQDIRQELGQQELEHDADDAASPAPGHRRDGLDIPAWMSESRPRAALQDAKATLRQGARDLNDASRRRTARFNDTMDAAADTAIQGTRKVARATGKTVAAVGGIAAATAGTAWALGKGTVNTVGAGIHGLDTATNVRAISSAGAAIGFWTFRKLIGILFLLTLIIFSIFAYGAIKAQWQAGTIQDAWNRFVAFWHNLNPITHIQAWQQQTICSAAGTCLEGDQEKTSEPIGIEVTDPLVQGRLKYAKEEAGDVELYSMVSAFNKNGQVRAIKSSCTAKGQEWQVSPAEFPSSSYLHEEMTCRPPAGGAPEGAYLVRMSATAEGFTSKALLTNQFISSNTLDGNLQDHARATGSPNRNEQELIAAMQQLYPGTDPQPLSVSDAGPVKVIVATIAWPVIGIDATTELQITLAVENTRPGTIKAVKSASITIPDGFEPGSDCSKRFDVSGNVLTVKSEYLAVANTKDMVQYLPLSLGTCHVKPKANALNTIIPLPGQPNANNFRAEVVYDYESFKEYSIVVGDPNKAPVEDASSANSPGPAGEGTNPLDPSGGGTGATFSVKASMEGDVGKQTASGCTVKPNDFFVALPDRSALGRCVEVCRGNRCVITEALDVGPWYTDDPYWEGDGVPQAYKDLISNNGIQSGGRHAGRRVNGAGIDLADGLFEQLGGSAAVNAGFIDVTWRFAADNACEHRDCPYT